MNLREMKKAITRETASWLSNSVTILEYRDGTLIGPSDPSQAEGGRHAILAKRVAKEDFGVMFGDLGWSLGMACWIACQSPATDAARSRFQRAMYDTAKDIRRRENIR